VVAVVEAADAALSVQAAAAVAALTGDGDDSGAL